MTRQRPESAAVSGQKTHVVPRAGHVWGFQGQHVHLRCAGHLQ